MFKRVRTHCHLLIAPVITLIITGVFFAVFKVFPFGINTVSWCDMNQQTIPLLMDFKDILDGKSGFFYSTANAGGMNFWGVFLFFLASPLYLTVKFVEKSHLIYLVNILLAVKLALSALTASVYFNKKHKRLKKEFSVVLSVMYSLCGYGIMYCQTLVWLDIMALFPLLVLSVDRLCRKNKPLMYGVILSLMMCICFYLSYMIVIYLLLAVPLYIAFCSKKSERKKVSFSFLFSSIVSAFITAPVWLCAFLQTSQSARGGSAVSEIMLKPLFENGANKLCILISTALCFAVLPFFVRSRLLKNKNVKYNLILLLFLMIPVFIDPINKMWHTGSYQSFPLRYGFIVVFTMLVICGYYFESVAENTANSRGIMFTLLAVSCGYILLSVYAVFAKKEQLSSFTENLRTDGEAFVYLLIFSSVAFLLYIICISVQRKRLIGSRGMSLLMMLIFSAEAFLSMSVNIGYAVSDGGVLESCQPLVYDSSEQPYYRTKTEKKYLHVNMVGGLGYNSFSHYTSLTNEDYMFAMKKLGYSSYWMEVGSNGGTVLTDALMAVRYSLGGYFDFESYYEVTNLEGELERGESSIYCPVGIASDNPCDMFETLGDSSRVDTQRKLAKNYFGSDKMIHEYKPDFTADGKFEYKDSKYNISVDKNKNAICQLRYSIDIKGRQTLYFDVFDRLSNALYENYYNAADIYVNGNAVATNYPTQKNNGIVTLGEFENTTAEILVIINKDISVRSFGVFGIDTNALKQSVDTIDGCDFYQNKSKLTAEYTSDKEKYLYMSIPYDKGLKAFVNGNRTDLIKVNDAFCALKLSAGENKIQISFKPYGMNFSVIIALIGFILLFFSRFELEKWSDNKTVQNISYIFTRIAFVAVLIVVYFAPFVLKVAVKTAQLLNV